MRISILSFVASVFMCALFFNAPAMVQAQSRSTKGSVVLKDQSISGKNRSSGVGQVVVHGGYYVATSLGCSVDVKNVNVADGTEVYVTLEYLSSLNIAPIWIGNFTIKSGKGYLSTLNSPTPITTSTGLTSMTLRRMDGSVLMTGSIKSI